MNYLQDRNIFLRDNWILHPQKHMYRHQVCDFNCIRTRSYGTKRDFQISMAAILKWPKIGSPSDLYLIASTFNNRGGLTSKKKLGLRLSWVGGAQ